LKAPVRTTRRAIMVSRFRLVVGALIGSFTKKILGPYVHALVVKTESGLFAIDPEDRRVGKELRMNGKYGLDEVARLQPYLNLDSRVLVVGAHIGTLAIPIAKLCKEVIAIEANPRTFEFLEMNIAMNKADNCRAVNIAVSDRDETIDFLLSRANSGGSKRVPKIKRFMYYYDHPEKISIRAVSLDRYLERKGFDLIVMDIEGSEYFALKGMQDILSKSKVLAVEFLPHHLKNVSGVSVEEFLSVITPHFSRVIIPSKKLTLNNVSEFAGTLSEMYALEQGEEGLVFTKH
jgi:FkbM family methyltransferase